MGRIHVQTYENWQLIETFMCNFELKVFGCLYKCIVYYSDAELSILLQKYLTKIYQFLFMC